MTAVRRVLMPARNAGHGALRHASQVAGQLAAAGVDVVDSGPADLAHVQFTVALWGPEIGASASAYETWASSVPRPLMCTLHDVPGDDPDPRRDERRSHGYARVAAASDGIIVSSQHEAIKVLRLTGRQARFIELPLPMFDGIRSLHPLTRFVGAGCASIGVLGFVYPGKGHTEAIDAAARQSPRPAVVALGSVSPGHQALRRQLEAQAARLGVRFVVTGALADRALASAAAAITVPLAPNRLVSASASLLAWLGCQRRPIAARGDYSAEISCRHPDTVELYDDDRRLDDVIAAAISNPELTRLVSVPPWSDVGAQHLQAYCDLIGAGQVARAV